ncbi:MAG: folylpolyglutamate synthase/dihydrofolate synthase family protein [Planctomycetota bacterium]
MHSEPPAASPTRSARDAAVDWLLGRINYERVAVLPYNERQLKLDRMRQLLTRLGSPDAGLRIIHVAGTKGKGSTAAMIAAVLSASGRRTGVYSSPHLKRIEERFTIDGRPISADELVGLVQRLRPAVEAIGAEPGNEAMDAEPATEAMGVEPANGAMHAEPGEAGGQPTFFDITTAMALLYFADRGCDAVVLEVGLGGRLDSTNVCLPVVSVITSISLDHTRQLGGTLGAIAGEKAGIIKPGVPVVSGVRSAEPRGVIARTARERGCRLIEPPAGYAAGYQLGLLGGHQAANAAVALAVIDELRGQGWAISDRARRDGLAAARLPARVERFPAVPGARPAVVVDSAHNDASAAALAAAVEPLALLASRTLIAAVSRDKDLPAIARALAPAFGRVIATRFVENPRAVPPASLAEVFREAGAGRVATADDPASAWRLANEQTPRDGLVVIAGSFFIAAELRPVVAGG